MTLKGQVAVVTGSGGAGSGQAVAARFAALGAAVVVSDLKLEGARATLDKIVRDGGQAAACIADMRIDSQIRDLIAFAERTFGRLDILVNCASAPYRPGEPLEHWSDIVATDLLGAMHATRYAIDAMRRTGGGAIVHFGSTSAFAHGRPRPGGSPAYDVAKAGVTRLATMLGYLAGTDNIRVNCIAPDWIAVPEVQSYLDSLTPAQRAADGVPSRLTPVREIADAVVRLATDETLHGRIMVWWSDDEPRLIPWGDPGYATLI